MFAIIAVTVAVTSQHWIVQASLFVCALRMTGRSALRHWLEHSTKAWNTAFSFFYASYLQTSTVECGFKCCSSEPLCHTAPVEGLQRLPGLLVLPRPGRCHTCDSSACLPLLSTFKALVPCTVRVIFTNTVVVRNTRPCRRQGPLSMLCCTYVAACPRLLLRACNG
jgi:hypothetical protein